MILTPIQQAPATWDQQRALPGPPLSKESSVGVLLRHNVTLGFGWVKITDSDVRLGRFELAWVCVVSVYFIGKYSLMLRVRE